MPNHISNIIRLEEDESRWREISKTYEDILAFMKSPESPFDFNRLIPYPKRFRDLDDAAKKAMEGGAKWDDVPKDGYNQGGYEWCCNNWGTKWNAYEIGFDYNAICFDTAWSTPTPIFEALSKQFPDVTFLVEYADEDAGYNCGKMKYRAGQMIEHVDMGQHKKSPCPAPEVSVMFAEMVRHTANVWVMRKEIIDLQKRLDGLLRRERENANSPE